MNPKVRVRVETFGCRANKYDTALLRGALAAHGYALVSGDVPFDLLLLNTCTVTAAADRETRRTLRRYRRALPDAKLVLTGCLAAVSGGEIPRGVDVDLMVPNRGAEELVRTLDALLGRAPLAAGASSVVPDPGRHSRFFYKVQDGCNVHCTFCIIPRARGASRSVPMGEVIRTLNEARGRGYREAILSGINLGDYGRDLPGRPSLATLLEVVLRETGVERLRLGSVEPWGVRDELIALVGREERLMSSIHIPLQSGARAVLKAMKRPSTPERYRAVVERLRAARPGLTLWLDVLVGFPGETDALFDESLDFVSSLNFTKLHVFPFSPRPGTPAATLPGVVPGPTKRERVRRLLALSRERFVGTLRARVGSSDEVLVEEGGQGHTRDNLPLRIVGDPAAVSTLRGAIVPVHIDGIEGETLVATREDVGWEV